MPTIKSLTRDLNRAAARCAHAETGSEYAAAHADLRAAREALDAALAADSGV